MHFSRCSRGFLKTWQKIHTVKRKGYHTEVCFQHFKLYVPWQFVGKTIMTRIYPRMDFHPNRFFAKGCGWPLSYLIPERCCHRVEVGSELFRVAKKCVGTIFRSPFFVGAGFKKNIRILTNHRVVIGWTNQVRVVTKSHVFFSISLKKKGRAVTLHKALAHFSGLKPAILWVWTPLPRNKVANEGKK